MTILTNNGQAYRGLLADRYENYFIDFAAAFRKVRQKVLGPAIVSARRVCDLCCGPGTGAVEMATTGRRVYAVDLSKEFCALVRAKARKTHADIRVVQADMRDFHLPESVEIVTCQFDSINHLPRKRDLHKVVRCVSEALGNDGLFFFDVYMTKAHRVHWPHIRQTAIGDNWEINVAGLPFDKKRHCGKMKITSSLFHGSQSRREVQIVQEISWTDAELQLAFRRVGMRVIDSWNDFQLGFNLEAPGRRFYLAKKVTLI
jgi:SAM-dependent methyltransferase